MKTCITEEPIEIHSESLIIYIRIHKNDSSQNNEMTRRRNHSVIKIFRLKVTGYVQPLVDHTVNRHGLRKR